LHANTDPLSGRLPDSAIDSPFAPANEAVYRKWREAKLELRSRLDPTRVFELDSGERPDAALREALREQVAAHNFVLFESSRLLDKQQFVALNREFGLLDPDRNLGADDDGVSSLHRVDPGDARAQYIPYTNRALNWHTDGYYNPPERRINAFALYCVEPAARGGDNYLCDHEYMYLLLRDEDPALIEALMCDDLMRIPANVQQQRVIRPAESGPVYSQDPETRALHMRYTSRPRNIVWKSDRQSERALNRVREILLDKNSQTTIRLRRGQGLICNNILHGREAYQDHEASPRLVYRTRYRGAIELGAAAVSPGAGD